MIYFASTSFPGSFSKRTRLISHEFGDHEFASAVRTVSRAIWKTTYTGEFFQRLQIALDFRTFATGPCFFLRV